MINEKNKFLTVSWLSGLLSAEIFISTGEWGVQMPPLTSENSHFLRLGPQGAILVMGRDVAVAKRDCRISMTSQTRPICKHRFCALPIDKTSSVEV